MPGQHHDGGAEPDPRGAGREIGEQVERSRELAGAREMVLDQEDALEAQLLRVLHVGDEILVVVAVTQGIVGPEPGPAEQSEFHLLLR